jgi:hypothetical protein
MRVSTWRDRHTARAREAFVEFRGEAAALDRAVAIARLETKVWRGQPVYRLTCQATFGRGPHDQFVPEGLLWALIDLGWWQCPFHRP